MITGKIKKALIVIINAFLDRKNMKNNMNSVDFNDFKKSTL